jgi:PAS domain S-box-containing protein
MPKNGREYESGLVALVALIVALACGATWWDIEQDRETVQATSTRLTDSLAESMESHVQTALRDARNAALSAALLIEGNGGLRSFGGEKRLHEELKRELSDEQSTARLVAADATGRVLASSADYPVRLASIEAGTAGSWPSTQPSQRQFRLGKPQRSPMDGALVLPYSCDIFGADGKAVGVLRAELRIEHFLELYRSITTLNRGAIVLMSDDGVTLMRAPLDERFLGQRGAGVQDFLGRAVGASGHLEYRPERDGITRYYSWRRVKGQPLILAVGLDKDAVMAPWVERAFRRAGMAGAASAAIVALAWLLVLHTRRLVRSRIRLRESESRYWAAMENSTVGVTVTTMDGRWKYANPAMCAMIGYTRQELDLLPLGQLTAPEFRESLAKDLARLRSGRADTQERESCMIRKDGRRVWVSVHASVLCDAQGEPAELLTYCEDVTERRNAEIAIRDLNNDLERRVTERTAELSRVNEDLEAFSSSAAHDLRGPLGRISIFADILAGQLGQQQGNAARSIESIKRQARQMTALIDDLLALSRTGRGDVLKVPVAMKALVADICEELAEHAKDRNVNWIIQDLPDVWADRGLLREALVNLIGNAFKYTRGRDPAVIEVGTDASEDPAEAVFFVRDNGAGFDMAYAADLFAPFKRLHSVAEFEGTGIGLAIVRRIIERNGGRVWAEGEPDKGATFRFALKLVQSTARVKPAAAA